DWRRGGIVRGADGRSCPHIRYAGGAAAGGRERRIGRGGDVCRPVKENSVERIWLLRPLCPLKREFCSRCVRKASEMTKDIKGGARAEPLASCMPPPLKPVPGAVL